MRHGCLALTSWAWLVPAVGLGAEPPPDHLLAKARSAQFDIQYVVNDEALPLRNVQAWYTFDGGSTWHNYGGDEDAVPPMTFRAQQEGVCGLYFVASNEAGASGSPPDGSTVPHKWLLVDFTPPVAQLHVPQVEARGSGPGLVKLRWTAVDAHLADRPIELDYRDLPDGPWRVLASDLPNSGCYDWPAPADCPSQLMFRLTVEDRAGHVAQSASAAVDVRPVALAAVPSPALAPPSASADTVPGTRPPNPSEQARAQALLRRGQWHRGQGEHELAATRFSEALKLDPRLSPALVELGGSLYSLGRYDESARAYQLALQQEPGSRDTRIAMARTLVALKDYPRAETSLREVIGKDAADAEAWLHLGDVAIYRGNEVEARECYRKAATLDPRAESVAKRAQARLDDITALTRRYSQANAGAP